MHSLLPQLAQGTPLAPKGPPSSPTEREGKEMPFVLQASFGEVMQAEVAVGLPKGEADIDETAQQTEVHPTETRNDRNASPPTAGGRNVDEEAGIDPEKISKSSSHPDQVDRPVLSEREPSFALPVAAELENSPIATQRVLSPADGNEPYLRARFDENLPKVETSGGDKGEIRAPQVALQAQTRPGEERAQTKEKIIGFRELPRTSGKKEEPRVSLIDQTNEILPYKTTVQTEQQYTPAIAKNDRFFAARSTESVHVAGALPITSSADMPRQQPRAEANLTKRTSTPPPEGISPPDPPTNGLAVRTSLPDRAESQSKANGGILNQPKLPPVDPQRDPEPAGFKPSSTPRKAGFQPAELKLANRNDAAPLQQGTMREGQAPDLRAPTQGQSPSNSLSQPLSRNAFPDKTVESLIIKAGNRAISPPDDVTPIQQIIRLKGRGPIPTTDKTVAESAAMRSIDKPLATQDTPALTPPIAKVDRTGLPMSDNEARRPGYQGAREATRTASTLPPTSLPDLQTQRPVAEISPAPTQGQTKGPLAKTVPPDRNVVTPTSATMEPSRNGPVAETPVLAQTHIARPDTPVYQRRIATGISAIRAEPEGMVQPALILGAGATHFQGSITAAPFDASRGPAAQTPVGQHPKNEVAPPEGQTPRIRAAAPPQTPIGSGPQAPAIEPSKLKPTKQPQRADPEGPLPLRSEALATPAPTQTAPVRMDLPSQVARQVAEVAQQLPGRPVEISLSPEELGRVRLSVSTGEAGLTVHVAAERPDTLDLMRRHIQTLAREFSAIGYGEVAFSFSSHANTNPDPHQSGAEFSGATDIEPPHEGPSESLPPTRQAPAGGLDLRL